MITQENYFKKIEEIGLSKLPDELKSAHDFLIRATKNGADWERVNKSAALKEVKDLQFGHLTAKLSESKQGEPVKDAKQVTLKPAGKKAKAPAEKKAQAPQKAKKEKVVKPKAVKQPVEDNTKKVGHYSLEQRLIRRFASYDGRKVSVKVLLSFTKALQKAMTDLSLRKNSQHANLLLKLQDAALALIQHAMNEKKDFIEMDFKSDWAKSIHVLANSEAVIPSVPLLKRYINMLGLKPSLEKVENLLKDIKRAFSKGRIKADTLYRAELEEVQSVLDAYIDKRRSTLLVSKATLNGLEGIAGKKLKSAAAKSKSKKSESGYIKLARRKQLLGYNLSPTASSSTPRASSVIGFGGSGLAGIPGIGHIGGGSVSVFGSATYNGMAGVEEEVREGELPSDLKELYEDKPRAINILPLKGDLAKFLGDIEQNEYAMVLRGDPGAGKSRLTYQLMNLFSSIGLTVTNFSLESSKDSKTAQDYKNLYIHPSNKSRIFHADRLPNGLDTIRRAAQFTDVVVIDSWSKIGVKPIEFEALRKEFKKVIWIVIFQSTTNGTSRGGVGPEYDGDSIVHVHGGGIAVFEKNRNHNEESRVLAYDVFNQRAVPRSSVTVK